MVPENVRSRVEPARNALDSLLATESRVSVEDFEMRMRPRYSGNEATVLLGDVIALSLYRRDREGYIHRQVGAD